jgi:transglutaminase-like putative cysteine protease
MMAPPRAWRGLALPLVLVGFLLSARTTSAASPPPAIGPPGAWVVKNAPPTPRGTEAVDDTLAGLRTLLRDEQVRFVAGVGGTEATYVHFVFEITSDAGPAALSRISSEYDPSYQRLVWHDAHVRRGGVNQTRLDPRSLHLVRREKDMESDMLDGLLTSSLILDDLRVGDVVEWSYTRSGRDPTLGGKLGAGLVLAPEARVASLYTSLIVEDSTPPTVRLLGPEAQKLAQEPTINTGPGGPRYTYVWSRNDVGGLVDEEGLPSDYIPRPFAQISTFTSWGDVVSVSEPMFREATKTSPSIEAWAKRTRETATATDDYLLAASRFVQDEVRYVGLELGLGRRRPAPASVVLKRRYGDCKDKAALLIALLAAGGIEAHPALVSTTLGAALEDRAPSATLFDHVIVQATLPAGGVRWIDATSQMSGGDADRLRFAPFGRALVLRPVDRGTGDPTGSASPTSLSKLEAEDRTSPIIEGRDHLTAPDPTGTAEATLTVERTYRRSYADQMRLQLRRQSDDEKKKTYVDLYRESFPQIHAIDTVKVSDDRTKNELSVRAELATPSYWSVDEGSKRHLGTVPVMLVGAYFWPPETAHGPRRSPYALGGPVNVVYDIDVDLPVTFSFHPEEEVRRTSSFTLLHQPTVDGKTLHHRFELNLHRAVIEGEDYAAYQEASRDARELVRRQVYIPLGARGATPASGGWEPKMLAVLLLAVGGLVWAARKLWRHDPKLPRTFAARGEHPVRTRIGGWLAFFAVSLTLRALGTGVSTGRYLLGILPASAWAVPAETAGFSSELARLLLLSVESSANLAVTGYFAVCVGLLYRRRASLRLHLRYLAWAMVAVPLLDAALVSVFLQTDHTSPAEAGSAAFSSTVWALIWTTYLQKSRRVAETLVVAADPTVTEHDTLVAEAGPGDASRRASPEVMAGGDATGTDDEATAEPVAGGAPRPRKRRGRKRATVLAEAAMDDDASPAEIEAPSSRPAPATSATMRRRPAVTPTEADDEVDDATAGE